MRRYGISLFLGLATLLLASCATTIQAPPPLKITQDEKVYLKIVPAPNAFGLGMTMISLGGAAFGAVDMTPKSKSPEFREIAGENRIQAWQKHLLDQIIADAGKSGLIVMDAAELNGRPLQKNEQLITLRSFGALYIAKTIAHSYQLRAFALIDSSQDGPLPEGQRRYARDTRVVLENDKYEFATSAAVLQQSDLAMQGIDIVIDMFARHVAQQLLAARDSGK
ncbi:hypothetical protein [Herbaspirillum rhizosphaerae]|uniref:hypothetical protein n=1 Tax=Herbaspirillum rhizosphaerae TaxID=346179 RepID=UPI00067AACE3|nr:hypothetical protein [Herbaspirillum rhizosphaerae]